MPNRNALLGQKLSHSLNEGRTLNDLRYGKRSNPISNDNNSLAPLTTP